MDYRYSKDAKAIVLGFHRIGDPYSGLEPISDGLKLSAQDFTNIILWLKKEKYNFLTLDELANLMNKKDSQGKNVVITFDDGYKDNLYELLPICKKYNIPFAVYMTAGALENQLFTWWNTLEELIMTHDSLILSDNSEYDCSNMNKKWETFWTLREKIIKIANGKELEKNFKDLFKDYKFDLYEYSTKNYLNKEELIRLDSEPLCTIGAHTYSHISMDMCSKEIIVNEMTRSIKILEDVLQHEIEHFAYPFGTYNKETLNILTENNFNLKTFTTVNEGFVSKDTSKYEIPRISSFEKKYKYSIFNFSKQNKFKYNFIKFRLSRRRFDLELLKFIRIELLNYRVSINDYEVIIQIGENNV